MGRGNNFQIFIWGVEIIVNNIWDGILYLTKFDNYISPCQIIIWQLHPRAKYVCIINPQRLRIKSPKVEDKSPKVGNKSLNVMNKSPKVGNKFINLYGTGKNIVFSSKLCHKEISECRKFWHFKKNFWHNLIVDNQNIAFWKNISGYILEEEEQMIMYQRSGIYFIIRQIFSPTVGNLFPTFGDLFPTFGDILDLAGIYYTYIFGTGM